MRAELTKRLPATQLEAIAAAVLRSRAATPAANATLVAISGIDGSGKGYLAGRLESELRGRQVRAAHVNIDGWLALPDVRFSTVDPGGNFYRRGLRLDEMFDRLVLPLRQHRSVCLDADIAPPESSACAYRRHRYEYRDIDVILLDGIFLLASRYRRLHDLALWVDCTFETGLERALARNQEGLPAEAIAREYRTIYFPAQRLHAALDRPRDHADLIVVNDPRLDAPRVTPTPGPRTSCSARHAPASSSRRT